jgi:hypothetical protein
VTAPGRYAGRSRRAGRLRLGARARAVAGRALGCAVAALILLVLAVSAGPTTASGASLTLTAVADAYVRADQSGTNFGKATQLASNGSSTTTMISYLRFDVTGLSGPPASATLSYYSRSTGTTRTAVRPVTGDWSEDTLTYATRPAYGAAISTTAALTAGTWASADVSSVVTGNGSYSFALTTTATATRYADSRETANPPQLLVTETTGPTPTPTASTPSASATPSGTTSATPSVSATGSTSATSSVQATGSSASTGPSASSETATAAPPTGTTASTTLPATSTAPSTILPATSTSPATTASSTAAPPPTATATTSSTRIATPTATTTTATTTKPSTSPTPTATSSPPPDPVIALTGDIACDPDDADFNGGLGTTGHCHMKTTASLTQGMKPTAVLTLGDHQYNSGSASDFLASYDKSWNVVKSITHPVVGNHEYGTSGASGYFGYFKTAATGGVSCTSHCRGYYSFNLGSWHIVAINTECSRIDGGAGCATGSPQEVWLKNDLATHASKCTLVMGHRPRWSSNSFASADIAPLVNAMAAARVDLYVAGHSHSYERFAPMNASGAASSTGITAMVIGTGGSFYTGFGTVAPNSVVRKSNIFGVVKMTLRATSYDWSFVADPSTPFSDSGSRSCS